MINKKYKLFLVFYIIVVIYFIILTINDHKTQDTIEHFNVSMMKRKERRRNNSECKTKCEVKFDNPEDIKVCKTYCKCKKKSNGDKKKLKKCKEIKKNIYRNDAKKMKRLELKDRIKNSVKQEKKEIKKEKLKKEMESQKKTETNEGEQISYVDTIINKYFSESDKDNLIGTHTNVKNFYKDVKSVFRMKK